MSPLDITEGILGAGLTGYGAYRARRALQKIQRNRAKGRDWRGRPTRRYSRLDERGTEMEERGSNRPPERSGRSNVRRLSTREMDERESRPLRTTTFDEEDIGSNEPAGSRETRARELRQAREIDRSRPNRSSIMDDEEPEEEEPDEFRQARPQAERSQPRTRGRSLRERFRMRASRPSTAFEPEETEMGEIQYGNVEEDPTFGEGGEEPDFDEFEGGEGEGTEMRTLRTSRLPAPEDLPEEPVEAPVEAPPPDAPPGAPDPEDDFRPVSLDDPDNPSVQQRWNRNFRSRIQRFLRKPPTADPETAETELQTAQEAETSAQAEATEADTQLEDIDDAFQQSRANLERQQNELRQTRSQLQEVPEEDEPTDLPDTTFDEAQLDAQAEADVAGEQAEGLEDAGDEVADLDEMEEDLGDDAGDVGDAGADIGDVAETAVEGGGEAVGLEESAGAAEAIGGGPEDPIGDVGWSISNSRRFCSIRTMVFWFIPSKSTMVWRSKCY
jgi:hypothetical protein